MNSTVSRIHLKLGLEGWRGPGGSLYGPGHGLMLRILQSVAPEASKALHDANVRKPLALTPLTVQTRSNGVAEAALSINVWDTALANMLREALTNALDLRVAVRDAPAILMDVTAEPPRSLEALIPDRAPPSTGVRFDSACLFSLGRRSGRQQYGLLPIPELVVQSWLRAWIGAGGPVEAALNVEALRERLSLREVRGLNTQVVRGEKTALTGFTGMATYAWVGDEPWGGKFLATLASFAEYCGTGAKTGHGFGCTRICHRSAKEKAEP